MLPDTGERYLSTPLFAEIAADMNEAELRNYEGLHEKVEEGIVSGREDIDSTKKDLVEAKRIRKNRMEYDALAKVIQTHPDRDTRILSLPLMGNAIHGITSHLVRTPGCVRPADKASLGVFLHRFSLSQWLILERTAMLGSRGVL